MFLSTWRMYLLIIYLKWNAELNSLLLVHQLVPGGVVGSVPQLLDFQRHVHDDVRQQLVHAPQVKLVLGNPERRKMKSKFKIRGR